MKVFEKIVQEENLPLAADSDRQLAQWVVHIGLDHLEHRYSGTADFEELSPNLSSAEKHYCRNLNAEHSDLEGDLQNFLILGYVLLA